MRLNDEQRQTLFEQARALDPNLGALFQNPMDITPEDLNRELRDYYQARNTDADRWRKYHEVLGALLCFPETMVAK